MTALLLATTLLTTQISSNDAIVMVNGEKLVESGFIEKGRILLPMRAVFERLGASVDYDDDSKKIVATKGERTVTLLKNESFGYTLEPKFLDAAPRVVDGKVYVPLRFVSESLGANVVWDRRVRTAFVTTNDAPTKSQLPG